MYDNPCGSCYDGLGQVDSPAWWEAPVTQISGAIAQRIGGPTSPYSPGTYLYGDTALTTYPAAGTYPAGTQVARAPGGMGTTGTTILLLGAAVLGLKLAGVF